jgi:quercetin dioxygenase-like cupin family protein
MGARETRQGLSNAARSRRGRARSDESKSQADSKTIRRFRSGFRWGGVPLEAYKLSTHGGGEFRGASRQVLIGRDSERVRFHVRYFELEPGGFTSLERHRHSHVVIGIRGRGRVRIGRRRYSVARLDTVYIAPDQPHQLSAVGRGAFGFLCIVDARRDRPRPVVG